MRDDKQALPASCFTSYILLYIREYSVGADANKELSKSLRTWYSSNGMLMAVAMSAFVPQSPIRTRMYIPSRVPTTCCAKTSCNPILEYFCCWICNLSQHFIIKLPFIFVQWHFYMCSVEYTYASFSICHEHQPGQAANATCPHGTDAISESWMRKWNINQMFQFYVRLLNFNTEYGSVSHILCRATFHIY